MTGFGRATGTVEGRSISIELKSVNSKQLDMSFKCPSRFRELEPDVKKLLSANLFRGKVELYINSDAPERSLEFNHDVIRAYYSEISKVKQAVAPDSDTDILPLVLRMPEVSSVSRESLQEEERNVCLLLVKEAIAKLDSFRLNEGERAQVDLEQQVNTIVKLLADTADQDQDRGVKIREKLLKRLGELDVEVDQGRLEQEMVYYLEKLDVNEERVRLQGHCDFFLETLHSADASKGKKLGFIAQEMGREINTLGSKANDSGIQHIVVQMKDCLEKLKEQVLNVL